MRNFGQAMRSNESQRTIEIRILSLGLRENFATEGPHLAGVSHLIDSSGRRARERSATRSVDRSQLEDLSCETCYQKLELRQQSEQCSGCGRWTHVQCHVCLDIGHRWHVLMCIVCKNKVEHWFRIVEASQRKRFKFWDADEWFENLLEQVTSGIRLSRTSDENLNNIDYFMAAALDVGLKHWGDPQRVFRTPTEGHDSPHVEPPGLPTPKAGPTSPQEFMQQGAASSSRQAAGGTEFHMIDSGQRSEQYAGGYRQGQREYANLGERNLLEGRTGARA